MRLRRVLSVAASAALAVLAPASAASDQPRPAVLILSVPALRADDMRSSALPTLQRLASNAAAGWINTRTFSDRSAGDDPLASAYLTIGSGARAASAALMGGTVNTDVSVIRDYNRRLRHPVTPGHLGMLVRKAGLRIRVAGNTDTAVPGRHVLLLAMDDRGGVDEYVAAVRPDPRAPFGIRTDLEALPEPEQGWLTVWEFGDLLRADEYAQFCTEAVAERHRLAALRRLNDLLARRWEPVVTGSRSGRHPCIAWFLVPDAPAYDALTPTLLVLPDGQSGLLFSPSTRLPGVLLNVDVLPSLSALLHVPPPSGLEGRAVTIQPCQEPLFSTWLQVRDHRARVARLQFSLGTLRTLRLLLIALLALLVAGAGAQRFPYRVHAWARGLAGAYLGALVLQVFAGFVPFPSVETGAPVLAVVALGSGAAAASLPSISRTLGLSLAWALTAGTAVALAASPQAVTDSWLGPNVMVGVRFYGIGNELAGVWLGASLLALVGTRTNAVAAAPAFAVLGVLALLPNRGANLGASLSFLAASIAVAAASVAPRCRIAVVLGSALILALLGAAALYVSERPTELSHLGRLLEERGDVGNVIVRKLATNVRLTVGSPWTITLIASLLGVSALARKKTCWRPALVRVCLPALAAVLLLNDSGIVAAALAAATVLSGGVLMLSSRAVPAPQPQGVCDHGDR